MIGLRFGDSVTRAVGMTECGAVPGACPGRTTKPSRTSLPAFCSISVQVGASRTAEARQAGVQRDLLLGKARRGGRGDL